MSVKFFRQKISGELGFRDLFIVTLLVNIIIAIAGFSTGVLTARMLGPTGRGELAAIQTWPQFLSLIAVLGLPDSVAYYSALYPKKVINLLVTAIRISILSSFILAAIGYYLIPYVLFSQPIATISGARAYLLYIPIVALLLIPSGALRGKGDILGWNLYRSLPIIVWLLVILGCTWPYNRSPQSITKIYLLAMAFLALIISPLILVKRLKINSLPPLIMIKPLLSYGLPSALRECFLTLNIRFDQMAIAAIIGPHLLGLYVVAVSWTNIGSFITSAFSSVIFPKIAKESQLSGNITSIARFTRLGIALSLIVAFGTISVTPILVPLVFGISYVDVVPVSMLLGIASGIASIIQIFESILMAIGKPRIVLLGETIGLIITFVLLYKLLPQYQLMGAAFSSLVSYLIVGIFLITVIMHETGLNFFQIVIFNKDDFSEIIKMLMIFKREKQ